MNHQQLWKRLVLMYGLLMLFTLGTVLATQQYQLKHGLLKVIQQKNQDIAETIAQRLSHAYAKSGDWRFLTRMQMLGEVMQERQQQRAQQEQQSMPRPLQRIRDRVQGGNAGGAARTNIAQSVRQDREDKEVGSSGGLSASLEKHLAILDQDEQVLMGNPQPSVRASRASVIVDNQIVGYVAVEPLLQMQDGKVKELITQQIKAMMMALVVAFLVSLLAIYFYSKKLSGQR